jgi:hypothetical protein
MLVDVITPQGERLKDRSMHETDVFTAVVYQAHRAAERLTVGTDLRPRDVEAGLWLLSTPQC